MVILAGSLLSWIFWEELHSTNGSVAASIRNVTLVIAAPTALLLAIWRSIVSARQATTAQRQTELSERGFLNERYQKGAEMLGSQTLSVRMGGVYALERLAREHSKEYHVQILRLFCGVARDMANMDAPLEPITEDHQAILEALSARGPQQIEVEKSAGTEIELMGARLPHLRLLGGNLSDAILMSAHLNDSVLHRVDFSHSILVGANLSKADLRRTVFHDANLSEATLEGASLFRVDLSNSDLSHADLSNARIADTDFSDADLTGVNLSGAVLNRVTGLPQGELDRAEAESGHEPKLYDSWDPESGDALMWDKLALS